MISSFLGWLLRSIFLMATCAPVLLSTASHTVPDALKPQINFSPNCNTHSYPDPTFFFNEYFSIGSMGFTRRSVEEDINIKEALLQADNLLSAARISSSDIFFRLMDFFRMVGLDSLSFFPLCPLFFGGSGGGPSNVLASSAIATLENFCDVTSMVPFSYNTTKHSS
jgi:hypothetical protein